MNILYPSNIQMMGFEPTIARSKRVPLLPLSYICTEIIVWYTHAQIKLFVGDGYQSIFFNNSLLCSRSLSKDFHFPVSEQMTVGWVILSRGFEPPSLTVLASVNSEFRGFRLTVLSFLPSLSVCQFQHDNTFYKELLKLLLNIS